MRKRIFYPKLALGNLRRNRQTYAPYLLACAVSIFTFYTLLAINLNGALDGMRNESVVKSFASIGTGIMSVFCGAVIFYTNSFLIKRRKKELGLYSILGMEKKNIAILMFFETFFIAVIALAAGIALGLLLSQLLFWALLKMARFPVMVKMPVTFAPIAITFALFGALFLLTLLTNLRQVHIANPVNLLAGARQGEREPKTSWPLTVFGVLCLGGGYFTALYFTSPVNMLTLFPLAVLLVIVGTYCLFTTGSIALLKLLRKNKNYYYRPRHFISVSGMIYRMKQNAAGLATICVLSCMVLVTVSSTVSMNAGAEESFKARYPNDYDVSYTTLEDEEIFISGVYALAEETGVGLINLRDFNRARFTASEQDGSFTVNADFDADYSKLHDFELITLYDYNRNESANEHLAEGEALLLTTGGAYERGELTLSGLTYKVRPLNRFGGIKNGRGDIGRNFIMVLPEKGDIEKILAAAPDAAYLRAFERSFAFDLEGGEKARGDFETRLQAYMDALASGEYFQSHSRFYADREDWYATNGGFLFLGVYFGILFMLAAALIIYYKQLSEGYDDAERFDILQKVGMGKEEVKRTINRQILAVFFIPLIVAAAHVTVAFFPISRVMVVFGVYNIPLLAASSALTALAYATVYWLVFRRTAGTYFGIVRRKAQ